MKSFEIKVYSRIWTFKKTINPKDVTSEISFSEDLEWGQWDLLLSFRGDFWTYLSTDIVEIREVDEENKDISRTYTGIIEEISVDEYETYSVVNLQLLWVFTALNDKIFKSGASRQFTASATPWNLVKMIIDSFNTEYWSLSWWNTQNLSWNLIRYTASSIDVTWSAANYEFDNDSCLDAIKKALEDKWFSFFIWSDWICYVQQDSGQSQVSLTVWRQVIKVNRKIHKRDMINKLYHERAWSAEQTYIDPSSVALFWIIEKKEIDWDIQDAWTQNTVWSKIIQDYAYERNEISVLMKPQKTSSIIPWMILTVNNMKTPLVWKKITKIQKQKDSWTLYVGDFISFWNSVLKK